jgi:carotenoid cleavage dioxygenase-like enzyme
MASADTQELPWHLQGNYGPVDEEIDAVDLQVEGEVPVELEGAYYRNGFNPPSGWSDHWFFGTGMIHRVELSGGRAGSYRNRYVRTPYFDGAPDLMTAMMDPTMSPANTSIIRHAGRYLALEEAHRPWEVTADLETVSCFDFGGRMQGKTMTAHPKLCPETGELLFFGYSMFEEPYLTYYRADASGALVQTEDIDIGRAVMMHDFNVTRNHVVFMDLPIVVGEIGPQYKPEEGARLGVMPRNGTNADVVWYDVAPCTVFHPVNSYEDGSRIVMDVCKQEHGQMRGGMQDLACEPAKLWRWTIDTANGSVKDEMIDDRFSDFPRIDDRRVGLDSRFGFAASFEEGDSPILGRDLIKYDLHEGTSEVHSLGATSRAQEPVFVPKHADSPEGEGFVIAFSHDEAENETSLVIIDAENFSSPPLARVVLPQRVPYGAHGNWIGRD